MNSLQFILAVFGVAMVPTVTIVVGILLWRQDLGKLRSELKPSC